MMNKFCFPWFQLLSQVHWHQKTKQQGFKKKKEAIDLLGLTAAATYTKISTFYQQKIFYFF